MLSAAKHLRLPYSKLPSWQSLAKNVSVVAHPLPEPVVQSDERKKDEGNNQHL
jgi:hypothetical protein